jgi:hypothetical protein
MNEVTGGEMALFDVHRPDEGRYRRRVDVF